MNVNTTQADTSLKNIFLKALPLEAQSAFSAYLEHETQLRQLIDQLQSIWPDINLSPEIFLAFIAERVREPITPEAFFSSMKFTDLYWACGCVQGDKTSISIYQEQIFPHLEKNLLAFELSSKIIEDIKQHLFQKLFIGDNQNKPKICYYLGEGDFLTWLRVVAIRHAIDLFRKGQKEAPLYEWAFSQLADEEDDPEMLFLKQKYHLEFQDAFKRAIVSLSSKERNLLRYQLIDELTWDQMASLYHVHRATIARWLHNIRSKLFNLTRQNLLSQLDLPAEEFESIIRLIQSQMHITITRLLTEES